MPRTSDLDDQVRADRWLDGRLPGAVPTPNQPSTNWAVVTEMRADRLSELAEDSAMKPAVAAMTPWAWPSRQTF